MEEAVEEAEEEMGLSRPERPADLVVEEEEVLMRVHDLHLLSR
jgi:hypothetical protein